MAIRSNFSTGKHTQLLGWFNRNYIKTGIIPVEYSKIYTKAFEKRQKGDYEDFVTFSSDEVKNDLDSMIKFVELIEELISK